MWSFYRHHVALVLIFAGVWTIFIAMRVAQASFFGPSDASLLLPLLAAIYVFVPWFCLSLGLGWLMRPWTTLTRARAGWLALAGAGAGVLHVALMTSSYWVLWPDLVANVTVAFVFTEQWLKWFHFELLVFAACVLAWRWRLRREPAQIDEPSLLLPTEEGVAQLRPEDVI